MREALGQVPLADRPDRASEKRRHLADIHRLAKRSGRIGRLQDFSRLRVLLRAALPYPDTRKVQAFRAFVVPLETRLALLFRHHSDCSRIALISHCPSAHCSDPSASETDGSASEPNREAGSTATKER